jgi:hypothetical protein
MRRAAVLYSLAVSALYAADYAVTAWALANLPHADEANPLWPLAPVLTPLAASALATTAVRLWDVKPVRRALHAALAIALARVVNNLVVVLAGYV